MELSLGWGCLTMSEDRTPGVRLRRGLRVQARGASRCRAAVAAAGEGSGRRWEGRAAAAGFALA